MPGKRVENRLRNFRMLLVTGVMAMCVVVDTGASPPQRIVSINICGDLLALSLAPRARIASVTFLAGDPNISPIADRAEGIALNYGKAEEVLALDPDLVLAGRYTARATVNLLQRLGYPVMELDIARSLDDARSQIRAAAGAMGVAEGGEKMITALDRRIESARAGDHRPRALAVVYGPNGYTLGPRSLSGSLIEIVGFDNLAARAGIESVGHLPLEHLLLAEPDVLIAEAEHGQPPAMATQILDHPAMRRLRRRITVTEIPRPLWSCPGPWLAEALDHLVTARTSLRGRAEH